MRHKIGRWQKEVLSGLYAGLAFQFTRSASQNRHVVRTLVREWEEEEQRSIDRAIDSLYESKLVTEKENTDGTYTLVLSDMGNRYALVANLEKMEVVKPKKWDEVWRVVLSDIPERQKLARDAFREHLKQLHFVEFQKSVWVHAYDCREQIEFLLEFYEVKRYVRFGELSMIDNDLHLRKKFGLLE